MKIGVISDTHLQSSSPELEELNYTVFREVDLILHAGDLVSLKVLEAFSGKEVIAVRGNMDLPDAAQALPPKKVVTAGKFRIGLIHGWGAPVGLEKKIRREFDQVDAIVYGHTHQTANHVKDGVLFFNPGTFKGGWVSRGKRSVGLITVDDHTITGRIIEL